MQICDLFDQQRRTIAEAKGDVIMVTEEDFNELANTVRVLNAQIIDLNKELKKVKNTMTSLGHY